MDLPNKIERYDCRWIQRYKDMFLNDYVYVIKLSEIFFLILSVQIRRELTVSLTKMYMLSTTDITLDSSLRGKTIGRTSNKKVLILLLLWKKVLGVIMEGMKHVVATSNLHIDQNSTNFLLESNTYKDVNWIRNGKRIGGSK